jgi:UDP-glucose 4-epimerase
VKILVTGSAGHLGEALVRTLKHAGHEVTGTDLLPSPFTARVGSITNREHVKACMQGVETVLHSATLHKPHVATHSRQSFIDTNISGTLNLLEEAAAAGVRSFIFTSTTSTFGDAMRPPANAPAAWVTEEVVPIPKNIYGVTKIAAEQLCELIHRNLGLACIILRTSRFFPEVDDQQDLRQAYDDRNIKINEFLYRRVDIEDVVSAHLLAIEKAPAIGFGRYIISATTPFKREDLVDLRNDAPAILKRRVPAYETVYTYLGWRMFPGIDRVYVNDHARDELGWSPNYTFNAILDLLKTDQDPHSPLSRVIGSKGYHAERFNEGPYPVES